MLEQRGLSHEPADVVTLRRAIAAINAIPDADVIGVGQVLIIPPTGGLPGWRATVDTVPPESNPTNPTGTSTTTIPAGPTSSGPSGVGPGSGGATTTTPSGGGSSSTFPSPAVRKGIIACVVNGLLSAGRFKREGDPPGTLMFKVASVCVMSLTEKVATNGKSLSGVVRCLAGGIPHLTTAIHSSWTVAEFVARFALGCSFGVGSKYLPNNEHPGNLMSYYLTLAQLDAVCTHHSRRGKGHRAGEPHPGAAFR